MTQTIDREYHTPTNITIQANGNQLTTPNQFNQNQETHKLCEMKDKLKNI